MHGVSVIICCYNSAVRLRETLKHLSLQNVPPGVPWEIIVVDNHSTDDTKEAALQIWSDFEKDIPFKIIEEPRQGLSFARETGAKNACYEFLLYCDDDNWLDDKYVHYAYCIMKENNKIGVLGGGVDGVFETEKPVWFERFQAAYAIGKPLAKSGIANARTYLAGAGMVIRKSALELLQIFHFEQLLSDRKGNELSSGGDVELCIILRFLDYDLYYDERLKLKHFMPSKRLTWKYCVNMMSRGHSVPQIYFDFYFYCYEKLMNREKVKFIDGYFRIVSKLMKNLIKNLFYPKNIFNSFKCLIKPQPGSRKEIELKATFHKLKYLFAKHHTLRREFRSMNVLILKIKECRNNLSV